MAYVETPRNPREIEAEHEAMLEEQDRIRAATDRMRTKLKQKLTDEVTLIRRGEAKLVQLEAALNSTTVSWMSEQLDLDTRNNPNIAAPSKPITSGDNLNFKYLVKSAEDKIEKWKMDKKNTKPFELHLNLHLGNITPQHWIAAKIIFKKDANGNVVAAETVSLDGCGEVSENVSRVKAAKELLERISRGLFVNVKPTFRQGVKKPLQAQGIKSCGYYMLDMKRRELRRKLDGKPNVQYLDTDENLSYGYLDNKETKVALFNAIKGDVVDLGDSNMDLLQSSIRMHFDKNVLVAGAKTDARKNTTQTRQPANTGAPKTTPKPLKEDASTTTTQKEQPGLRELARSAASQQQKTAVPEKPVTKPSTPTTTTEKKPTENVKPSSTQQTTAPKTPTVEKPATKPDTKQTAGQTEGTSIDLLDSDQETEQKTEKLVMANKPPVKADNPTSEPKKAIPEEDKADNPTSEPKKATPEEDKLSIRKQVAEKLKSLTEEQKTQFINEGKIPQEAEKEELKYYPKNTPKPGQKKCEVNCLIVFDEKDPTKKYIQMSGGQKPFDEIVRIEMERGQSASNIMYDIQHNGLEAYKSKITVGGEGIGTETGKLKVSRVVDGLNSLRQGRSNEA